MFRKPKRSAKAALRNKKKEEEETEERAGNDSHNQEEDEQNTSQLLEEAKRVAKKQKLGSQHSNKSGEDSSNVMHTFQASGEGPVSAADLATRTAQHHSEKKTGASANVQESTDDANNNDGIYRGEKKMRNKFLAGPLKASAFVRTTSRFDYQPDICKDYKDTGFCGFGDSCIYLHDRGDTLTGWQLEQQWEEQRKKDQAQREIDAFAGTDENKAKAAMDMPDDGLPFACYLCREAFKDPVVTSCGHFFCQACILEHVRNDEKGSCPICKKDTHGVFNQPTKLISKKRRLLSSRATWEEFADASRNKGQADDK